MISYGIACLAVLALSWFDRRAMPFALVIAVGWLVGYALVQINPADSWRMWPLLSASSGVALTYFWRRDPHWRWRAVATLAGVMLLLDVAYLGFRWQRVPIEVEYSRALDFCLSVQLVLIGFRGAINGWVGLRDWVLRGVGRGNLVGDAPYRKADAE